MILKDKNREELIEEIKLLQKQIAEFDMPEHQRMLASQMLRESEGRLRDITFSFADWIWEVDENGVYTFSSSKGPELFGRVIGKTPFDFMPPDEAKRVAAIFSEIAANKAPIKDLENWNIRKDGERICLLTSGVPILDNEGNLKGYRGVDKDITERKLWEKALRESEAKYRLLFERSNDAIFLVDISTGRYLDANCAAEKLTGRSVDEVRRLKTRDVCPQNAIDRMEKITSSDETITLNDIEYIHKDGTIRSALLTAVPLGGNIFFGIAHDITERKKADETLRKSEAALRNSQKDLQKLAGRLIAAQEEELRRLSREIHDDLTQRMAVIAIDAGKLEIDLGKIPEVYPYTVQMISQIKDELIRVSKDVHNISRQLHPTILDDLGLVRAIESECSMLMKREDIEIAFQSADAPPVIPKDVSLCLYRIAQEGLRNIIRHARAGDAEIILKGADSSICLTIRDAGIGFDPAEVRQQQGLGLASMRERASLVGGNFSIKSQCGHGTVISVSVPLTGGGA